MNINPWLLVISSVVWLIGWSVAVALVRRHLNRDYYR